MTANGWFQILFFLLLVWPIYVAVRSFNIEKQRWANSDHPMVSSS